MIKNGVECIYSEKYHRFAYYDKRGCRLPELCVFDLSNVSEEFDGISADEVIKIWKWVKNNTNKIIKKYDQVFTQQVIRKGVDVEIRLVSECNEDLKRMKQEILSKALLSLKINATNQETLNILKTKRGSELTILNKFRRDYDRFGPKAGFENKFKLYSEDKMQIGNVWKEVEMLGDYFIFIAHSGVPFMCGFNKVTGNENIALIEFHLENDPYSCHRKAPYDGSFCSFYNNNIFTCPVIIDKSYTGNTLMMIKNKFPNSKTVGLFPKTEQGVKSCDYFVFNNKLFSQSDINLGEENWYLNFVKKSLKK